MGDYIFDFNPSQGCPDELKRLLKGTIVGLSVTGSTILVTDVEQITDCATLAQFYYGDNKELYCILNDTVIIRLRLLTKKGEEFIATHKGKDMFLCDIVKLTIDDDKLSIVPNSVQKEEKKKKVKKNDN